MFPEKQHVSSQRPYLPHSGRCPTYPSGTLDHHLRHANSILCKDGRFIMIKHNFRKKKLDRAKERSIFLLLPVETTEEYQSQIPDNIKQLDFFLLLSPNLFPSITPR